MDSAHPPVGDHQQSEKYLSQLINVLRSQKYPLTHSDLSKFDPGSFQDHFRLDLGDYFAEISHSKHPQSGNDVYSLIFTNVAKIKSGLASQAILSYLPLSADQFARFKSAAGEYFAEQKKLKERRRFEDAMRPIDDLLNLPKSDQHPEPSQTSAESSSHQDSLDPSEFFHDFKMSPVTEYTPPKTSSD